MPFIGRDMYSTALDLQKKLLLKSRDGVIHFETNLHSCKNTGRKSKKLPTRGRLKVSAPCSFSILSTYDVAATQYSKLSGK